MTDLGEVNKKMEKKNPNEIKEDEKGENEDSEDYEQEQKHDMVEVKPSMAQMTTEEKIKNLQE